MKRMGMRIRTGMKSLHTAAVFLLIAAIILLSSGVMSMTAQADLVDTSDNVTIRQTSISRGKIGRNMNLSVEIWNESGSDWENPKVVIANLGNYMAKPSEQGMEYIFPFEKTAEKKLGGTLKAGSHRSVSIPVRVRADLSEGYYYVTVEVRTEDDGYIESDEVNVYVSAPKTGEDDEEDENKQISFVLGEGQSTPYGVYPNVLNFAINMRNSGLADALDVTAQMVLDKDSEKFPFDINDGNYDRTFERVAAGETVALPYSMAIREDVYSGFYPIGFIITYRDNATGDLKEEENTFWVHIKNKEKEKETAEWNEHNTTSARIVVESFHTVPEEVIAGEPFQLILNMKNASSNISASNIMFTLKSETAGSGGSGSTSGGGSVFTTQSGSSSTVVNSLEPGEVTELQLDMQSVAGIEQRSYYIDIVAKYDSPEYKNAETTVRIDVPVHQIARMNVGTIEVQPDNIKVGSAGGCNVTFPINNTGKVILYNVMVSFEADSIAPAETYVGNIQPGQTGNADAMLYGAAPTTDDGKVKVIITYEDVDGQAQEPVEKELTLFVNEDVEEAEDMMVGDFEDVPMEPTFMQKYLKYMIGAAVLAAVIAAAAVIRHRRKKKAALEDLEDEIS